MSFSRESICGEFYEMNKLMQESYREAFSKVCNKILNNKFIYGQIQEDKNDFLTITRWRDEISKYFSLIDYTLEQDNSYKIFFLKSRTGRDRVKLKKMESVLVLLFRKFYYVKGKKDNSSVNILITFNELIDEINKTHIYKEGLGKGQLEDSLKILKRYKIINFDSKNYYQSDAFEIYPTVLYVVTNMDLKMIGDKLSSYRYTNDGENLDEVDED